MYKPDEKDIDGLSKNAAEHYHAPGSPAWDALRKTLDKEMPQEKEKKRRGWLFFFFAVSVFLAGICVWYTVHSYNSTITTVHNPTVQKQVVDSSAIINNTDKTTFLKGSNKKLTTVLPANAPAPVKTTQAESLIISTGNLVSAHKTKHLPGLKNTPLNSITYKKISSNRIIINGNTAFVYQIKASHKKENGEKNIAARQVAVTVQESRSKKQHPILKNKNSNAYTDVPDDAASGITALPLSKENAGKSSTSAMQQTSLFSDTLANKSDSQQLIQKADTVITSTATIAEKNPLKPAKDIKAKLNNEKAKAILVGITGGIDYSTVKFAYHTGAGYNIGITAGYQFNKHWSVYTGLVYNKKNYKLNGHDYHPPEHYWTTYVNLQTVAGYCHIWEMPLTARYTFNPASATMFFTRAGLSSYFLKKQKYEYAYKNNTTGAPGTAAWIDSSSFNHYFSVLDISAGFEKKIGKHMNWLVEPYAKIPIHGVGFGSIRLSSFGINLTVQYRHLLKP